MKLKDVYTKAQVLKILDVGNNVFIRIQRDFDGKLKSHNIGNRVVYERDSIRALVEILSNDSTERENYHTRIRHADAKNQEYGDLNFEEYVPAQEFSQFLSRERISKLAKPKKFTSLAIKPKLQRVEWHGLWLYNKADFVRHLGDPQVKDGIVKKLKISSDKYEQMVAEL